MQLASVRVHVYELADNPYNYYYAQNQHAQMCVDQSMVYFMTTE